VLVGVAVPKDDVPAGKLLSQSFKLHEPILVLFNQNYGVEGWLDLESNPGRPRRIDVLWYGLRAIK
jgi:hypothetical protein